MPDHDESVAGGSGDAFGADTELIFLLHVRIDALCGRSSSFNRLRPKGWKIRHMLDFDCSWKESPVELEDRES